MNRRLSTALLKSSPVALVAVLSLLLAACGGGSGSTAANSQKAQHGGSLKVALAGGEVETLDPSKALGGTSITVLSQIMEPLFELNTKGDLEPLLVTRVQKEDNDQKWIFHLREGVEFSNGKPLTAADAAFSVELARKSASYASLYEPLKTVTATSPTTLEITTTQPLPTMEAILSIWVADVVPKNYGGISEKEFAEHPIGTGPFKLASWKHGSSVTLDRNGNYWKPNLPYADELTFVAAAEDNSRLAQLRGGDLNIIEAPPLSQLSSLEQEPGFQVAPSPPTIAQYVVINAREKKFQDPRIREAIDLAVDRPAVVKTAMAGHGELGASFLVPSLLYHDSSLQPPARDVAKAKELVAEARAGGADTKFTLVYGAGEARYALSSQVIQSNLEEVGFEVSLKPLDSSSLLEILSEGEYEVALEALSAGVPDPSENVALYTSTESFFTGAENATVTKLAEEGTKQTDPNRRRQIYYQLQEEVANERYLITLAYEPYFWAGSNEVVGLEPNAIGGVLFSTVSLARPGN